MAVHYGNENQSNATFVSVIQGRFAVQAEEGDEGAVARVNKNGDTVYETFPEYVSGTIYGGGVITREASDGKSKFTNVVIKLKDSEGITVVNLPYSTTNSKLMQQFAKRIPNINVEEEVQLVCFPDKEKLKKGYTDPVLLVKQNGVPVPFAFTKDNQGDLPQPFQEEDEMGELKWNWKKHNKYLIDLVNEFMDQFGDENKEQASKKQDNVTLPKKQAVKSAPKTKSVPVFEEEQEESDGDSLDIPF